MPLSNPPVTAVVVGAGSRGITYANYAIEHPDLFKIVGVAEPKDWNREHLAATHRVPTANTCTDWRALAARPKLADVAIISTMDRMHVEPAMAFAGKGYHILLEKPMAPTEEECIRIVEAVKPAGVIFGVCHVLRYTAYTQALKGLLDAGAVGEIVSIQHLEPVGFWHQAHSFVRGNWRNSTESSSMLLQKSCHDLDWLRYIIGRSCRSISSFGSLAHFKRSEKPAEAGEATRCLDCAYEPSCPYSARKIYFTFLAQGSTGWPVDVVTPEPTEVSLITALRQGPYGRCVYECDNDVVDHQVVSLEFVGGCSAVFTMTAFNKGAHRKTRIFGTRGEIYGDGARIEHYDFLSGQTRTIDTRSPDASIMGGHGGGDYGLMQRFVAAVTANDPSLILSGADESLESHRMVFAAERARLERRVVDL